MPSKCVVRAVVSIHLRIDAMYDYGLDLAVKKIAKCIGTDITLILSSPRAALDREKSFLSHLKLRFSFRPQSYNVDQKWKVCAWK